MEYLKELVAQIMPILVITVVGIFSVLSAFALNHVRTWAASKSKGEEAKTKGEEARAQGETIKNAVTQIAVSATSAVNEIEATTRRFMADGVLSEQEIATLKQMAVDMVNAQVPQAMETLKDSGMENMKQFVRGKVEEAVAAMPPKVAPLGS